MVSSSSAVKTGFSVIFLPFGLPKNAPTMRGVSGGLAPLGKRGFGVLLVRREREETSIRD
jgi:hypothetical protein